MTRRYTEEMQIFIAENVEGRTALELAEIVSSRFPELGEAMLSELVKLCGEKGIHTLHFECHWLYRDEIPAWREAFAKVGTSLKIKTGVESFDYHFREHILHKGISEQSPEKIADDFDECCLLFGLKGQNAESMRKDIETGLKYFERVCINIFVENKTLLKPDKAVISEFVTQIMPDYIKNDRVDILISNTDFGVGASEEEYEK